MFSLNLFKNYILALDTHTQRERERERERVCVCVCIRVFITVFLVCTFHYIYIYIYIYIYRNPPPHEAIFKRSITGLNSDFFPSPRPVGIPRLKYKNSFLRGKNRADHVRHLIYPEWRKEKYGTKKWLPSFCQELLIEPSVRIQGPELKAHKLKTADWFRHSLFKWSLPKPKIKWKLTIEVLPRKFN